MRITSKGQVTIPHEIRERAGLLPHTEVDLEFDGKVCASAARRASDPVAAPDLSRIYADAEMSQ